MEIIEKKFKAKKVYFSILNYSLTVCAIFLFIFLFFGRISPSWLSEKMKPNKSIVKSAFFFKNYVSEILEDSPVDSGELENPFGEIAETGDEISYDDFYASFAAMVADSVENEEVEDWSDDEAENDSAFEEDDDSEMMYKKAEKIEVINFRENWDNFKASHEEIAEAFELSRKASLLTFFAVVLILTGVFLIYSKNLIRKIGLIISCVGSLIVLFSLNLYFSAFDKLYSTTDFLEINPMQPHGITLLIITSIVIFLLSLTLIVLDKKLLKEKEITELETEKNHFSLKPFQFTFRILSLLLFICLFIPGANPARISENINRNISLFTTGFSYSTFTENLQRAIIRGWLPEYVTRIVWVSSFFTCLGIIACCVGSCMSVGNNKLKRYAHLIILSGSFVSFISMFGILYSYLLISSSPNPDRVLPLEPSASALYFILGAGIFVCSLISFIKTPAPEKNEKGFIAPPLQLFLMLLPCLILVFLFSYLPLWGWRYAFFDYSPGDTLSLDTWVGFKWFKAPFENAATRSDIIRVLTNTLAMSGLGIFGSWLPMAFAIFLAEIKNVTVRKIIQTLTTIPNFISWVLVYAIAFCIFGTEGFISSIMVNSGVWDSGKNMLMGSSGIWFKMWLYGIWKGLGWSAIMYIAAIAGIDQQLYEAATVDGAGRFQKMWHITLPELLPTYLVLLILSISGILSNGMDQYLCFKNPTNKGPIEVLDLYVYQLTFGVSGNSNIPFSTVVSMFKSLVSVVLLFISNKISKAIRGNSIF